LGLSTDIGFNVNGSSRASMTDALFTVSVPISVPDSVYSATWHDSKRVPTKNAVYDKIELVTGTRVACAADVTRTAQTLADITGLSIACLANSTYEFEAVLMVGTSAVTTGVSYGVQFSAAGASVEALASGSKTTAASMTERIAALNTATGAFLTTSAQAGGIIIKGVITVGANAGNLTIQHLKVTSGTSTVRAKSWLKAIKIS
jgi:hypothetical protein